MFLSLSRKRTWLVNVLSRNHLRLFHLESGYLNISWLNFVGIHWLLFAFFWYIWQIFSTLSLNGLIESSCLYYRFSSISRNSYSSNSWCFFWKLRLSRQNYHPHLCHQIYLNLLQFHLPLS